MYTYKTSWYYQGNNVSNLEGHCNEFSEWIEEKLNENNAIDWKIQKDMIKDSDGSSIHVWVLVMKCDD